jgi:hypothetical protein
MAGASVDGVLQDAQLLRTAVTGPLPLDLAVKVAVAEIALRHIAEATVR